MGVLGNFRDAVTIINRTLGAGKYEQDLNVRYDGEDIILKPGENHGFPKIAIPYARKQNPLMGSKHPINPNLYISLVGVKDSKDDVTPISEATLARAAGCLEVLDRDGSFHGEPMRKVTLLKKTKHSAYEAQVDLPSEFDVNRNIA
jgi:hypothetical protein